MSDIPSPSSPHPHAQGLAHDLQRLAPHLSSRRQALRWFGGALGAVGALPLLGCGGGGDATAGGSVSSDSSAAVVTETATGVCAVVPEETAGPYPGDGSNSANGGIANALALSGIVRSDIRSSIAGASGTAAGVPLTLTLTLGNTASACSPLAGHAIYLWHCNRAGQYSMYSSGVTDQNYLRGVQVTDDAGQVTFQTIFPGCYDGRMPHMHFEVYPSLAAASSYLGKVRTSQLAFPTAVCQAVYASADGYSASAANLSDISFATDNVFSDGVSLQLVSIAGDVDAGYVATVSVSVAA